MGYAISAVLFAMVMEVFLRGLEAENRFLKNAIKIRVFMDDNSNSRR